MTDVSLKDIPEGQTFRMSWRHPSLAAGKVLRVGPGSVHVHVPRQDGDGWERTHFAPETQVEPCSAERYNQQGFGTDGAGGRIMNKSVAENPVDIVHKLCGEIIGWMNPVPPALRDEVIVAAVAAGVNINTAKTQFYAWRKLL